jgi:hypothetical protein
MIESGASIGRGYHNEGDRHGHYDNNRQNNYDADRTSDTTPPSATVMIKGLPAHTTEPTVRKTRMIFNSNLTNS